MQYAKELETLKNIYKQANVVNYCSTKEEALEDFFSNGFYDSLIGDIIQAIANSDKEIWIELSEQGYDPYELAYYDFRDICLGNAKIKREIDKVFDILLTVS